MSDIGPCSFIWDGESMTPSSRNMARLADKYYTIGERYLLVPHEQRSAISHRHYFASVNEAWQNLPETYADRFPTPEHLRKWALIKAGYFDSRSIVESSKAQAQRLAAFMKPIDDFAVVTIEGSAVTVYTAKSQSMRAMGKGEFQRSKNAVLEVIASMTGVSVGELAAARAA
jgi:hypothetical protein